MKHYDFAVIGTGPAGQKASIQAAKLGKRVCVIEKNNVVGGAMINTGTIPSKALREAAMHLTGTAKRGLFGASHRVKRNITVADLTSVSQRVISHKLHLIRDALERNGVDLLWGKASFIDAHQVKLERPSEYEIVHADKILIATGSRAARPGHVPFNDQSVFCSDQLLFMRELPKHMIVVGAGVIGTEYACVFSTLGVRIILIDARDQVFGFLDRQICEAFQYHMRMKGITLRLGERVDDVQVIKGDKGSGVEVRLGSGKVLRTQSVLYAVGREGVCGDLGLENVGLEHDERFRLKVNENYQTSVDHIYAAGDVIGFPALASTAMEQGRLAACHAFGVKTNSMPELFPYGIYSVPEISMVGKTEKQLTDAGIPYEAGICQYRELARGQLLGDDFGLLKLLIHQDTLEILGVHAIGTGATELIHIGQAVMALKGTAEFFINNVFNFPSLAQAYKIAALNGINKLRSYQVLEERIGESYDATQDLPSA